MRQAILIGFAVGVSLPLSAARIPYRASIQGGGGGGKCTIEIEVDTQATVEVSGDRGMLISPDGRVANWRRFQCNQVMPRNPNNFRFRGIDGRGRQELMRPPNNNGGTAVVRIADTRNGREGYTFDLQWDGGGGYPGGGYPPPGIGWGGGPNFPVQRAVTACQDYVRIEARKRFGVQNATFERVRFDPAVGHNDWISGYFRSGRGEQFKFYCVADLGRGRIKDANIQRGWY